MSDWRHSFQKLPFIGRRPATVVAATSDPQVLAFLWQRPDLRYAKAADEHGALVTPNEAALALGDILLLVPGHCDPTVNLYDELVCFRGDRVEAIWPIAARGALL